MNYQQVELESSIELEPNASARHSIIWLHGLGADGNDFVPIAPELRLPTALNVRFIFPHAPIMPITINNGYEMRAWYDIYHINIVAKYDEDGISASNSLVHELIAREEARGIPSQNIILAGFSQGSVIALTTGLRYHKPLGGIIALSGYLPLPEQVIKEAAPANKNIPIFIAHGIQDPVVPYALGETAKNALEKAGYSVTWRSYPMPHTVALEEIHDISQWIQNIWK